MSRTVKQIKVGDVFRNKNVKNTNKSMRMQEQKEAKADETAHYETELCGFVPGHHMDD